MAHQPLTTVPAVDYGPDEDAMVLYRKGGEQRALTLGNRGPIRFDASGNLVAEATFVWQSSLESVATVTADGLVTAIGMGI